MDFSISERARSYRDQVRAFIQEKILPIEDEHFNFIRQAKNPWQVSPVISDLKEQSKKAGLWNLFIPEGPHSPGLSVVEYALVAEEMGHSFVAPEVFNCNAPDTGNMEVLLMYGSEAQKDQWLGKLLAGEIRSAFCMTEPEVASSDATNMAATAKIDGDDVVINGRKWWSTGIGHPDCQLILFMGLTDAKAHRHQQHSIVLVPMDTPGVKVERMLPVFGDYDEPYGHGEVSFTDVRVPLEAIVAGPGRGFEVAQGRLGPGRIHHCMRCIGASERALRLLIERAQKREAFGKSLLDLGSNREKIAEARIAIEQARLLTLKAAWQLDQSGIKGAISEVAQIKVVAPRLLQKISDQAIQIFGGAGLSQDHPLTGLFAMGRALRLADGPDEVHQAQIAKLEIKKYR